MSRNYWIIEGFDISGGASTESSTAHLGFTIDGATGVVIRKNNVHHIATGVCTNTINGNAGVYLTSRAFGTVIDNNLFYSIGRLRNGERGCSTKSNGNDHGIYAQGVPGLTIQRNVFYDTNRGWPIHVYMGGGGTTSNLKIWNNTFANRGPDGSNPPEGHILLASTVTNGNIKNNISYDGNVGMVRCSGSLTWDSNVVVDHNLSDSAIKTNEMCPAGVTFSNNLQRTSPDFVDAARNDFHLNDGSAAIDYGANVGLQFKGAAPDVGAYEFTEQTGDSTSPTTPAGLRIQ